MLSKIPSDLIPNIQNMIDSGLEEVMLPYKKGNCVKIGKMIVRKVKNGYAIYDSSVNKKVEETFCKASALAIAKNLAKGNKSFILKIKHLDKIIEKNYNDALFYKKIIKSSKDPKVKDIREIRLSLAVQETRAARDKIDNFIFGL